MTQIALTVSRVSKCYRVFENQRSRLMHAIFPMYTSGVEEIWALNDVSFEIMRGESVAIIGRNGGGKSTLLEILTGTLMPTNGSIKVNGRVSALLELGSGFNPEYSGRDNVILNGLLLGLSKDEIISRFAEIEAFAEIGAAIERPVKTYSSGMMMRLAFAVQVLCDPDILIIDEALSVGDFFFQQKCFSHIRNLRARGVTLLFVSHDMGTVRDLCERTIFLKDGFILWNGEVNAGINCYLNDGCSLAESKMEAQSDSNALTQKYPSTKLWGNDPLWQRVGFEKTGSCIHAVNVRDLSHNEVRSIKIGDALRIIVWYQVDEADPVHISLTIKNRFDQVINSTNSYVLGRSMPHRTGHKVAAFCFKLDMNLEAGEYSIMVDLALIAEQPNQGLVLDKTPWLGPLEIRWDYSSEAAPFLGMFGIPARFEKPIIYEAIKL